MNRWFAIALAAALAAWWTSPPSARSRPPGILVPDVPKQVDLVDAPTFAHGAFIIAPLAAFRIQARVLSREDYRFDREAALSPMDLALGWGAMSDTAILDGFKVSQGARYFVVRWGDESRLPLSPAEIMRQAANMHLVPADDVVARQLKRIRPGDLVHIEGFLIEASLPSGWRWRSSLTREDVGGGACELVYVRSVTLS